MTVYELNEITGLSFKQQGTRFYSASYIDGSPSERSDKTNARIVKGEMWLSEEGGESLPLKVWLKWYGNEDNYVKPDSIPEPPKVERKFVSPAIYQKTFPMRYSGHLFTFLTSIFGYTKVDAVFRKYSVGESSKRDCVFWCRNSSGEWLFDQVIPYLPTGKRNKSLKAAGWRKCKRKDGYTGVGVFGGHLITGDEQEVCVVESEKTALIMSLVDKKDRVWVACGGSNKTAQIKPGWVLYPDFDAAGSFFECVGCNNRNKVGCIIKTENGKRVKEWGCDLQSGAVKHWFEGLVVEDGDDPSDWVMNNLKK